MAGKHGEDYIMLIKKLFATAMIALVLFVSGIVSAAKAARRWHRRHHVVYAYRYPRHRYYHPHYRRLHRRHVVHRFRM